MFEIFDDILELVYVADIDTYELLYINKLGKEAFNVCENNHKKCYEIFQGESSPCSFCTNSLLKQGEIYSWQRTNPISGLTYILRDSLIDWYGKIARIEIAVDITQQFREKEKLRHALDAENMVLQCVRHLHEEKNIENGILNMLQLMGQELSAERTYIFNIHEDTMSNTYEWCAEDIEPQSESLQNLDIRLIERWKENFDREECVIIENMADIEETYPGEYETLSRQNINVLVAAPLKEGNKLIGFIGVDNPLVEKIQNIEILFNTLSYFVMNAIRHMQGEKDLETLSYCDSLTGLFNRNRYNRDIEHIRTKDITPIGVLFMDLNGLKKINDSGGHAKGDEALITCAHLLRNSFPNALLYRIGGDEFVAIADENSKGVFFEQVSFLHNEFKKSKYKVAIGTSWSDNSMNVEMMMQIADEEMYNDKRRFYRNDKYSVHKEYIENEAFTKGNPLLNEYNMLMSSMHISVSKHLAQDDFYIVWANDYFYDMLKYTKKEYEEVFHNSIQNYFVNDKEEYKRLLDVVMSAFESGQTRYETILHVPQKGGTHIWINLVGIFTEEKVNGLPVIYTVFTDITDIIQMQKEQVITYDALPGFVAKFIITKEGLRLLYGNDRFNAFFGESTQERPSKLLQYNLHKNKEILLKYGEELKNGEDVSFFIDIENVNGNIFNFQIFASCVHKKKDEFIYLVLFIDVTELTYQQKRLRELAFIDTVTGGRNRTCFELDAEKAILKEYANHYVLVYLDIQKFKVINDLFGIEEGNRTLKYVYHKLEEHLKAGEYAARLSSDNFNLLLKADTNDNIIARLQEIAKDINSFNEVLEHKYVLLLAAGIYRIDNPMMPIIQIQDRANTARKKNRGNTGTQYCLCQFYNHEDRIIMQREKEMENRMQDGLEQEQFIVYIQPKMSPNGKTVVGGEALVRWQHPKLGLLSPDKFIPLFEKNGFIVEVDMYVFEYVCKIIRNWIDKGFTPVPISVNMSKAHLTHRNFQQRYESIQKKYQIPSNLLEIEITETLIYENPQALSNVIQQFHAYGFLCSLDDFGSGHSSLNVLKDIYIDIIKLDKAFFSSEILENPRVAAIVDVVIQLARRLNMKIVAEGVETIEQAHFLEDAGCDILQGFLYSKPVPIEEFEQLVFVNQTEYKL